MPIRAIDHIDPAVPDVERSRAFYLRVLGRCARAGPLGVEEAFRYQSYRGTEEIVYLRVGEGGQVDRAAAGRRWRAPLLRRRARAPSALGQSDRRPEQRLNDTSRPEAARRDKPAATYSPGPVKAKYHRRCGA
jgi:catechol 2,3-dioxygenase-like lactoylglutathione lyase family enzyme